MHFFNLVTIYDEIKGGERKRLIFMIPWKRRFPHYSIHEPRALSATGCRHRQKTFLWRSLRSPGEKSVLRRSTRERENEDKCGTRCFNQHESGHILILQSSYSQQRSARLTRKHGRPYIERVVDVTFTTHEIHKEEEFCYPYKSNEKCLNSLSPREKLASSLYSVINRERNDRSNSLC